jgi:heme oxygenase
MNETNHTDTTSNVPWPTSRQQAPVPDTSMLPGSEQAPQAAVGLLKSATQGAHETIDRLAESAAPAVQRLGDSVSAAEAALQAKTDQLRNTRDEWAEGMRTTIRSKPLTCVVAALALGAVFGRITR